MWITLVSKDSGLAAGITLILIGCNFFKTEWEDSFSYLLYSFLSSQYEKATLNFQSNSQDNIVLLSDALKAISIERKHVQV